jgi:serine/threonine protein kinase/tetratricopeptide (TPR) repeat protein
MPNPRVTRLLDLFEAMLECPDERRVTFLERECGEDRELRREVEELLVEHLRPDGLLDRQVDVADPDGPDENLTGRSIGPYRVLDLLGEGGMGLVYRAEQEAPVRRLVALKLLRSGLDTRSVVRRFEAERQVLALMDHPGVARIYDAGVSSEGQPYFVMELFEGTPLTSFCDAHELSISLRLELLLQVADAVQHAHRRGIIHRDLKPSNVLVRHVDGRAIAKVIDFGIAKATHLAVDPAGAPETARGLLVGTPEYMSPEQISSSPDIDTRTDVYSMGTLLYELLVGVLPQESYGSVFQKLHRERDPPTPSARLRGMGAQAQAIARRRRVDPAQLRRRLSGELEWIVAKAIAYDRDERYGSVAELADDLRRHITDLPVTAGPPSVVYRARKFTRRHRAAVVAGGIAVIAVLLGVAGVIWSALAAHQAQAQTEIALERARHEAQTSQTVSNLLFETLSAADPEQSYASPDEARELKVVDVLARAGEQAGVRFGERPLLEATLRGLVGRTLLRLHQYDAAELNLHKALELRREHLGEDAPATLEVRHDLATAAADRGGYAAAESLHRAVLQDRKRVLGGDNVDALTSMTSLGGVLIQLGQMEEASRLYREALERGTRVLGEEHVIVTEALTGIAYLANQSGDSKSAAESYARIVAIRRRVQGPDHPATLAALNNLAAARMAAGQPEEAEALYRDVLERHQRVFGPRDARTLNAESNLGATLWRTGKLGEAAELFRAIVATNAIVLGSAHPQTLVSINNLGRMLTDQGQLREAEEIYVDLIPRAEAVLPAGHVNLALYRGSYGLLMLRLNRYAEAEAQILAALSGLEEALGPGHPRVRSQLERLVALYEVWGKGDRAAIYRERLADEN